MKSTDSYNPNVCVCVLVGLSCMISFESVTVIRALVSLGSLSHGPILHITLSGPLFGTRMHMSCVRIENTVLYPCPALICPLEFNHASNIILRKRRLWVCTKAPFRLPGNEKLIKIPEPSIKPHQFKATILSLIFVYLHLIIDFFVHSVDFLIWL